MAKQHVPVGGHEIDPVFEPMRGRFEVGIELIDPLGDVSGVELVPGEERGQADDEQRDGTQENPLGFETGLI